MLLLACYLQQQPVAAWSLEPPSTADQIAGTEMEWRNKVMFGPILEFGASLIERNKYLFEHKKYLIGQNKYLIEQNKYLIEHNKYLIEHNKYGKPPSFHRSCCTR